MGKKFFGFFFPKFLNFLLGIPVLLNWQFGTEVICSLPSLDHPLHRTKQEAKCELSERFWKFRLEMEIRLVGKNSTFLYHLWNRTALFYPQIMTKSRRKKIWDAIFFFHITTPLDTTSKKNYSLPW